MTPRRAIATLATVALALATVALALATLLLPSAALAAEPAADATAAAAIPPSAAIPPPDAPLQPGDALLIRITDLGSSTLPEYREVVDSDGNILLPYLGPLPAVHHTLPSLAAAMSTAYAAANIAPNAAVHITRVARFPTPPDRENLIRVQDPRRPIPAAHPIPLSPLSLPSAP